MIPGSNTPKRVGRPRSASRLALVQQLHQCLLAEAQGLEEGRTGGRSRVKMRGKDLRPAGDARGWTPVATKLRKVPPEIAIVERHRRRQSSVEEVILEMYHAAVPLKDVRRITDQLWGSPLGMDELCELAEAVGSRVDAWLRRPITTVFPYLFVTRAAFGRELGGVCFGPQLLLAVGIDCDGGRALLGVEAAASTEAWARLLCGLRERGLRDPRLIIGPDDAAPARAAHEHVDGARYQICLESFYRAVVSTVAPAARPEIVHLLRHVHAAGTPEEALQRAARTTAELESWQWLDAAGIVERHVADTLAFYAFAECHRSTVRTMGPIDRIVRHMRERHRIVGAFATEVSARILVGAWFRRLMRGAWGRQTGVRWVPAAAAADDTAG